MRSCSSRAMRPRSASAPRVCRRPNQRALSRESASTLESEFEQVALVGPVRVGRNVFDRDQPDERAPGPQRGVQAAAAQRREAAVVGIAEPVPDDDRVRRGHRPVERLRAGRRRRAGLATADAFGELRPANRRRRRRARGRRARCTGTAPAPVGGWTPPPRRGRTRPAASGPARAAKRGDRWRSPSAWPGRSRPRVASRSRRRGCG